MDAYGCIWENLVCFWCLLVSWEAPFSLLDDMARMAAEASEQWKPA